ncbi:MAG TPA: winged helix-turn-helix domain-containing protein [Candidatus Saccharimonadales bacterium]|nr:winged helix-turn-helix domain-containing protein [Candidatus Saccharimonadales bacterium]
MPSPIKLKEHLTADELYQRYRKCQQAREKLRWPALCLIAKGGIANHVAKQVGRSSGWMTNLARRFNELGPAGVTDQRGEVKCGVKPTLSAKQAQALDAALRGPAPDGGLWTSPKVAAWIKQKTGKQVHTATAWRAMRAAGFSLQVPRPRHGQAATDEEQAAFKKSSAGPLPE